MKNRILLLLVPIILTFGLTLTLWQVFAQLEPQTQIMLAEEMGSESALLKQYGGFAYAVTKQGDYAYLTIGSRLEVLDVSDPTNPIYLSQTPIVSSTYFVNEMLISGTVGYLAADYQVQVFDLSDSVQPEVTAVFTIPSQYINDMVISGTLLFLGEVKNTGEFPGYGGLRILDISDPFNPTELSYFGEGRITEAIAHKDEYVYLSSCVYDTVSTCSRTFTVLNVSDPTSPQEISSAYAGNVTDMEVYGNYLYHVEVSDDDFRIYDISNPASPTISNIVGFPNNGLSHRLEMDGSYGYLHSYNGITAYNLTNPLTPTLYGNYQPSGIYNVLPDGNFLYIAHGASGLKVLDTTTQDFDEVGDYRIYGQPTDIVEIGNYLYLLDGRDLHVLDITDPVNPENVFKYNHENVSHRQLIISDTLLLKASKYGQNSFEIIDVSNPLSPTHQSFYSAQGDNVFETNLQGNYAYLGIYSNDSDDLEIVDISNPAQPMLVSSINITHSNRRNYGIEVAGNYAYMVESRGGSYPNDQLTIIDISDKTQPEVVATHPVTYANTEELGKSLTLLNNHAYVGGFGVRIFDVTNPLSPTQVGVYTIPNAYDYEYEVDSQNGYLYVSARLEGGRTVNHILDVSDPTNPVKIGNYRYMGELEKIVGNQVYAYVPEKELGFSIYGLANTPESDHKVYLPIILKNP